jgi:hypothetical protein
VDTAGEAERTDRELVKGSCALAEAAEASARNAEWSASNTVPVSNDTAACGLLATDTGNLALN